MVMSLGVESCDWFALSLLCHHLMSSLHSNTPSSLISTYLLFIYSSMLFYSICSLFTFFSFLRTFPSSFPLTSCSGPIRGGSLSLPLCPSLDVPPPPPVPPDHPVTPEGPAVSCSSIIHTSFLPSANSSPSASPFATPQNHSPHRPPCFIISPLPRTLSARTRGCWWQRGLREDIPEVVVFPPEEEEEEPHLLFSATQEEQVAHDPRQAGTALAPTAVRQISSPSAWCVTCMKNLLGLSLCLSRVIEPRKKSPITSFFKNTIKTEIMLYTMS